MKVKRILRFYFSADSLERAFDNIILKNALNFADGSARLGAENICNLIGEKQELGKLWSYLDKIVCALPQADVKSLSEYAGMRYGFKKADADVRREINRAVAKFMRRACRLESFDRARGLIDKYYCLIAA